MISRSGMRTTVGWRRAAHESREHWAYLQTALCQSACPTRPFSPFSPLPRISLSAALASPLHTPNLRSTPPPSPLTLAGTCGTRV